MQNGVRRSYYIIFTLFFLILNRALVGINKHSSVHCFVQTEARSNNIVARSSRELFYYAQQLYTAFPLFPSYCSTRRRRVAKCVLEVLVPIAAGL